MSSAKLTEAIEEIQWWQQLAEEAEQRAIEEGDDMMIPFHAGRINMAIQVLRLLQS